MATQIGIVKTLTGEVTATAADGSIRTLQVGDRVYANELISTGQAGALEIEFSDGSIMDLGRNSQAMLDSAVFDPSSAVADASEEDVPDDVAAIQQALLEGEDPTEVGEATAAGAGVQGGNEGHDAVFVNYLNPEVTPDAGFETIGVNSEVDDYEDEQLLDGQPTAGLVSVLLDEDDLNFFESFDFVQNLLDQVRSEFQADTNLNIDNQPDAGARNTTSPGDDFAPSATFFSGTLNANFGSDGPGSITFNAAGTQPSGLTSGGQPVQIWVSADGLTLIGYVASDNDTFSTQRASIDEPQFDGADLIFSAQITDLETYAFEAGLFGPIDHPDSVEEGAFEENLLLNIAFTITDADGDAAQGIVQLNVDDDSPVIGEQPSQEEPNFFRASIQEEDQTPANADEDDIPDGVGNEDSDGDDDVTSINLPINFGADGPAAENPVEFSAENIVDQNGNPLTSNGVAVEFSWNADTDTLEGTADGQPVINIHVNVFDFGYGSSSVVSVQLLDNLDHPVGAEGESLGTEDNLNISLNYTATDADGDQASGSVSVSIDDDMPVIGTPEAVSVDEEGLTGGNAGDSYPSTGGVFENTSDIRIPGTGTSGQVTSSIEVSGLETINDVNVLLNLDHTFAADLDIFLISPEGTRVELTSDNGGGANNYNNTEFDDEAANSITSGSAPFTGVFRPEGSLADFDGENPNGTWTLEINDDFVFDSGTLFNWHIEFNNGETSFVSDDLPGEEASAIGSLDIDWGADNNNDAESEFDRSVTFTEQAAPVGLTAGGEPVAYNISEDGTVLTAYTGEPQTESYNEVFTVTLSDDGNGTYEFELPEDGVTLDHPEANTEDDIDLSFDFIATDSDGDSATGSFNVTVDDDAPVASGESVEFTVDEDDIRTELSEGNNSNDGDDADGSFTGSPLIAFDNGPANVSGSVASLVSFGADGAGTFTLGDTFDALLAQNLTSQGDALGYSVDGNVLTAEADGRDVFTLTLNENGDFTFALSEQLDHADADANGENNLPVDLSSVIVATDADGDAITLESGFVINVTDDVPEQAGILPEIGIVEDEALPNGNQEIYDSSYTITLPFIGTITIPLDVWPDTAVATGSLSDQVSIGADEAATFELSGDYTSLIAQGLTSGDEPLSYDVDGDTLYAVADQTPVFTLQLEADGDYIFTLMGPIDHVDGGGENLQSIDLSGLIRVEDYDGDAITLDQDFYIKVVDDSPEVGEQATAIVDDEGLVDGIEDGPEDDVTQGVDETTFDGSLNFSVGADQPATVGFASMDGETGSVGTETVTYSWNSVTNTLTATGPRGELFTVEVTDTESGDYTVTLLDNVLHESLDGLAKDDTENNAEVQLTFTVTDNDDDSVDGTLTVKFDDDTPVVTSQQLNLLTESFEDFAPDLSGNNWTVVGEGGGTIIGNNGIEWTVNGAGIEVQSGNVGGANASDGDVHAELDAHDSNGDGGSTLTKLSTEVDLPTADATLSFDFQPRPSDVDGSDMTVSLSGQEVTINVGGSGVIDFGTLPSGVSASQSSSAGGWTTITLSFTGLDNSSAQTLSFEGQGPANTLGAYIDNISLNAVASLTVDESALVDNDEAGASTTAVYDFSGFFTDEFGADGPAGSDSESYSLNLSGENIGSGLYTVDNTDTDAGDSDGYGQGIEIVLNQVGDQIVGSAGGVDYFTISVNDNGEVTLTQLENIWHADTTNPDDSQSMVLDAELLTLVKTITDADQDESAEATLDLGGVSFNFEDDAPSISAQDSTELYQFTITNEGGDAGYNNTYGYYTKGDNGEPVSGEVIWANVKENTSDEISLALQDPSDIGFFIIPDGDDLNDLNNGDEVTFEQDGDGNWHVLLDGEPLSGQGTNVLFNDAALNPDGAQAVEDNAAAGNQNWEDIIGGDNDFNDVNINVSISQLSGITVDETDIGNGDPSNATTTVAMSGAFTADFGADGEGDVDYGLSVDTDVNTGLIDTQSGEEVLLRVVDGEVEGYINDGSDQVVFTVTVNSDGEVTLTQLRAVEHDDATDPDEANSPATINAGAISLVATVTDADGDSADASLDLGVLFAFEDDGPSVDRNPVARVDDDVFDGNEGGIGDGPDANFVSGILGHDFGQDGAGSIAWSTDVSLAPNLDGFTFENGPNEGELLIKQDGEPVLTLTLNSVTGEYTVTQNAVIDHKDARNENNQNFEVTYIVTDGDGDTTEGLLKISVDDDTPTIDKASHLSVKEADVDNDGFDVIEANGQLSHINEGADGATVTSMSLQASADFNTLRVGGEEVVASQTGNVITVDTVGGEPVFELTYNSDGEYTYKQFQAFDHQNDNPNRDNSEIIKLGFNFIVTDADGDTAEGSLIVTVNDDEPVARYSSINVAELDADNDGEFDVIQQVQQAFNFDQGADGAQVTAIEMHNVKADGTVNIWNGGGADVFTLSSGGENIIVTEDGTTITGTVGENGPTAFTIELNNDGTYTYTQYQPLDHAQTPNGQADNQFTLTFKYTVTDADGDTDQAYVGINIEDDVPSVGSASHLSVQEADDDNNGFDVIEANGQLSHINEGADGATVTSMSLQASADFNTLKVGGEDVVASQTGNVITVNTVGGEPVFELTYNSDGEYTYKQFQAFDHQNDNPNRDNSEVIKLGFNFTVTDADGDTDDGLLVVQVNDDEPVALDDSDSVVDGVAEGNVVTAESTDGESGVDSFGADGAGSVTSVTFGNTTYDVPSEGSVDIDGEFGTLTLHADGSYEYNVNSENVPQNTETVEGWVATDSNMTAFNLGDSFLDADGKFSDSGNGTVTSGGNTPGFGVAGTSGANTSVPEQVNQSGSQSEALAFKFTGDVTSATVQFSNLFNNENGGEAMRWHAFDADGNRIDSGIVSNNDSSDPYAGDTTVSYSSNNEGSFTISDIGAFSTLVFEGVPYSNDGSDGADDSDFFVNITSYEVFGTESNQYQDQFTYEITDADGDSDSATLTIKGQSEPEQGELDAIAPVAADNTYQVDGETSGNIITDDDDNGGAETGRDYDNDTPVINLSINSVIVNGVETELTADNTVIGLENGTLVINLDGSYTYTPDQDADGGDEFDYTLVDPDGRVSAPATVTLLEADDQPTAGETFAFVDDEGLVPDGITGGTDDDVIADVDGDNNESTYSGTLNLAFGDDGAGSVDFASMNGESATVGTETVSFSWSAADNTLTATGPRGDLFEVEVTDPATGDYTVTMLDNVLHQTLNGQDGDDTENNTAVSLEYTVSDSDGDPATGNLVIDFDDDMPAVIDNQNSVLEVPVSEVAVTNFTSLFSNDQGGANKSTTNGTGGAADVIRWGGTNGSNYTFDDNDALITSEGLEPDTEFTLGTFTHNNFVIDTGDAIDSVDLNLSFNVMIDGVMTEINQTITLNHNETPNDGPNPNDVVSFDNTSSMVEIEVGDRTYQFEILGFKDSQGNFIGTSVETVEGQSNSFELVAKLSSTDDLPTQTGTVAADFGADGPADEGSITWEGAQGTITSGEIAGEFGTLTVDANGDYSYELSRDARDDMSVDSEMADSFTYYLTDADGDSVEQTLTIDIAGIANPVVAYDNIATASLSVEQVSPAPVTETFSDVSRQTNGSNYNGYSQTDSRSFSVGENETGSLSFDVSLYEPRFLGTGGDATLTWSVINQATNLAVDSGTVESGSSEVNVENLTEGDYKIELNTGLAGRLFVLIGYAYPSVSVSDIELELVTEPYDVVESDSASGNVIADPNNDGEVDIPGSVDTTLSVFDGSSYVAADADGTSVMGDYGELTIYADGSYTYEPNDAEADLDNVGNVDSFSYQLETPAGSTATATLDIRVDNPDVNVLFGDAGDNTLTATDPELNVLVGGAGDDLLVGRDDAQDVFVWNDGDQGEDSVAEDIVQNFNQADGDVLDLADLLVGEIDEANDLTNYLSFESDGTDTVVNVSSTSGGDETQQIVLQGVDLTEGGTVSDQQIIQNLLDGNNLNVDQS